MQRSDWGQFGKVFNDSQVLPEDGAADGRALKDRFGRLSVMMKELEGLKLSDGISMGIPTSLTGGFSMTARPFGI